MRNTNPAHERALSILKDNGWPGMSLREVADVLQSGSLALRLSDIRAISLDDLADEFEHWNANRAVMRIMGEAA
jgi:hypothetical protein